MLLKYVVGCLCIAASLACAGCGPTTPAERRQADTDFWTAVGEKFTNAEADLVSTGSSYDQHESSWIGGDIDQGNQEADAAYNIAQGAPWNDVEKSLTTAASAFKDTLGYFQTGLQNNDASAMMQAYNSYEIYKRNVLAGTKEARADYVRDGGKASVIMDFYGIGSGGDTSGMFTYYAHAFQHPTKKS